MEEIQSALKSPAWWFSAVVIALAVNLISSYLRDGTDRALGYAKRKLAAERQRKVESNQAFMAQLKSDPELRRFLFEAETRARLMSIALLFGAGTVVVLLAVTLMMATPVVPRWARLLVSAVGVACAYYAIERYALASGLERILLKLERERLPSEA